MIKVARVFTLTLLVCSVCLYVRLYLKDQEPVKISSPVTLQLYSIEEIISTLKTVDCYKDFFSVYGKEFDPSSLPRNQICVAYSLFDSNAIPQKWVNDLNTYFDIVIVSDAYYLDVYKRSGVTTPIFCIPLSRNLDQFFEQPLKSAKGTPFIFGSFSRTLHRKNLLTLIQAFAKVFGNHPDVQLQIHFRSVEDEEYLQRLQKEICDLALINVFLDYSDLDEDACLERLSRLDCLINISKGEGFSFLPREAMALGIPVIVTDNTAQTTLCKSGLVRVVPSLIEEEATYSTMQEETCSKFYGCSVDDVVEAMNDVFEHYDTYLKKSQAMREWVQQYNYDAVKSSYMTLLKPRKLYFLDQNVIVDGALVTSSPALYDKYCRLMPELTPPDFTMSYRSSKNGDRVD